MSAENSRLIRAALEALGREDPDGFSALLHPEIEIETAPEFDAGKQVAVNEGCLACHIFESNGNDGPGPELTHIGAELPATAIARSLEVGPGIMPSYADLEPEKFDDLVAFLASLR